MEESIVPVTELSNDLTKDIDKANSGEIVHLLHECDKEIFNGWKEHEGVQDKKFIGELKQLAHIAAQYVSSSAKNVGVILSGCGTSGRIAFLISRAFNELAVRQNLRPCYRYICSGGDHGLMKSVESFEDDWNVGKKQLEREADGLEKILFIGITCGLSAPFVGGQVEFCLQHHERFTPYLLGFNPANQARVTPIKGTNKVLLDIASEMEDKDQLLNPVVGPEAITGSSRMKGGTATKMILESIFIEAHQLASRKTSTASCEQLIAAYQKTLELTYSKWKDIANIVDMAGASLRKGGNVTYLGWGNLGIMGLIDAAECVPTFGASHDDIRCFIRGGYEVLRNKEGDLSAEDDASKIGFDYFLEKRCHTLSENDMVIFVFKSLSPSDKNKLREIAQLVRNKKSKLAMIGITVDEAEQKSFEKEFKMVGSPEFVHVHLGGTKIKECSIGGDEDEMFLLQCLTEVSLKWIINAVSTGAHILKGKVLKNYMIDLKLSNRKLFERAVSITSLFGKISHSQAKQCLLKSIYRTESVTPSKLAADISEHVKQASLVDKVIPVALLLSQGTFTIRSALKTLEKCPIVRHCIDENIQ